MLRRALLAAGAIGLLGSLTLLPSGRARAGLPVAPPRQQLSPSQTPSGPTITVPDKANLRSGPGVTYGQIGVLVKGQSAPALGRSSGGDWFQIRYPGVPDGVAWVYAPLVLLNVPTTNLPVIEPPPTATPLATATIDPTLAARFTLVPGGPTRLPTFTPPAPVVQPTLLPGVTVEERGGFPPALAIIGLFLIGVFGMIVSTIRRR
ncbi:MAG: SH3 domain-containing protein [Chloroflexi bacterium]|nr:SH3 domain-containing protein [Chloroflexota bacterium]